MAPLPLQHIAPILAMAGVEPEQRPHWLMVAHIAGGGDARVERSLRWLAGRASPDLPNALPIEEARETLRVFAELWPATEKYSLLRDDLAQQIARVADLASGQWTSQDLELLTLHEKNLRASYRVHAQSLRAAGAAGESWSKVRTFAWTWAGHLGFWVLLLFFYPRSPKVQAIFFWNPWVRAITGLGYVGLLLTWVPFLRRRLLAPFAPQLLADADLERFSAGELLRGLRRHHPAYGPARAAAHGPAAAPGTGGAGGASGLGKSLFIQYLLQSLGAAGRVPARGALQERGARGHPGEAGGPRPGHHLPAEHHLQRCARHLHRRPQRGDGGDAAGIVQFAERNFHGNILLATQRMEWTPPTTARLYVLQPLSDERIAEFLASREPLLLGAERARLRGAEYREACEHFVQQALSSEQPEELRRAMREELSNPMDLTVIAQMLAEGHSPDLFRLRQQQYELMARDYREVNLAEFPLKEFAEEAYKMRREDRRSLRRSASARSCCAWRPSRWWCAASGRAPAARRHREWRFRHDKIQEFFIAQTFLGAGNSRIVEHMGDPRFRGVYFLLALLLEPEHARQLRDQLVVHAAETRDHTVSDEFVTLLEVRREAAQVQFTPPHALGTTGS